MKTIHIKNTFIISTAIASQFALGTENDCLYTEQYPNKDTTLRCLHQAKRLISWSKPSEGNYDLFFLCQ